MSKANVRATLPKNGCPSVRGLKAGNFLWESNGPFVHKWHFLRRVREDGRDLFLFKTWLKRKQRWDYFMKTDIDLHLGIKYELIKCRVPWDVCEPE